MKPSSRPTTRNNKKKHASKLNALSWSESNLKKQLKSRRGVRLKNRRLRRERLRSRPHARLLSRLQEKRKRGVWQRRKPGWSRSAWTWNVRSKRGSLKRRDSPQKLSKKDLHRKKLTDLKGSVRSKKGKRQTGWRLKDLLKKRQQPRKRDVRQKVLLWPNQAILITRCTRAATANQMN